MLRKFRKGRSAPPQEAAQPRFRYENTLPILEESFKDHQYREMPFVKTYDYAGDYIDPPHRRYAESPIRDGMLDVGIEGWLLKADALKLYELSYFCPGDVLELGTYRGLSTSILLEALVGSGGSNEIVTVDTDPVASAAAQAMIRSRPGGERVSFMIADGESALHACIKNGRRFGLCFLDHSHRYEETLAACRLLPQVLEPGGFSLFHDYSDYRNALPEEDGFGIFQGVADGLDMSRFEFWGLFGCGGLFRLES